MSFTRIEPIRPKLIPPMGSKNEGVINGRQLYSLTRPKWSNEPVKDADGKPVLRKDTYGRNVQVERQPVPGEESIFFFLWDQGNGNEELELYCPPTEAELEEAEKKRRVEFLRAKMDERLAEMTPEEFTAFMAGGSKNKGGRPPKQILSDDPELQSAVAQANQAPEF